MVGAVGVVSVYRLELAAADRVGRRGHAALREPAGEEEGGLRGQQRDVRLGRGGEIGVVLCVPDRSAVWVARAAGLGGEGGLHACTSTSTSESTNEAMIAGDDESADATALPISRTALITMLARMTASSLTGVRKAARVPSVETEGSGSRNSMDTAPTARCCFADWPRGLFGIAGRWPAEEMATAPTGRIGRRCRTATDGRSVAAEKLVAGCGRLQQVTAK